jgi:hypothetical protein
MITTKKELFLNDMEDSAEFIFLNKLSLHPHKTKETSVYGECDRWHLQQKKQSTFRKHSAHIKIPFYQNMIGYSGVFRNDCR